MIRRWWLPGAVAFVLTGAVTASAQTVVVRSAPAGGSIQVVLNATAGATATANETGEATLPLPLPAGKTEIDATVFLDVCDKIRRLVVVERGQPAMLPEAGCDRRQIQGLYLVRRSSTLLVNLAGPNPSMMLLQRPIGSRPRGWSPAESGLSVFGGGGMTKFSDARAYACGNLAQCSGGGYTGAYTAGVDFWVTRYLGAEGTFGQTRETTVTGSGTNHRFTTATDARLFTISGKAGIPLGPVRLYGRVGAVHHEATSATTQTIDDRTVTVGGNQQVLTGGTQTNTLQTKGWAWGFGAGMEMWITPWLGFYGDAGRAVLRGDALEGAEGSIDDRATSFIFGARLRIGG